VHDDVAPSAPLAAATPARITRIVVQWPYYTTSTKVVALPVPDVAGRSVREAALALHRRGFRVNLHGLGQVSRTVPAGGETAMPGTAVAVWAE
jgi:hypothetical protein